MSVSRHKQERTDGDAVEAAEDEQHRVAVDEGDQRSEHARQSDRRVVHLDSTQPPRLTRHQDAYIDSPSGC